MNILERVQALLTEVKGLDREDRRQVVNAISRALPGVLGVTEPVGAVQWVPTKEIVRNEYNPNRVAPPEMRLLRHSMLEDGITMPVVVYHDKEQGRFEIVDGFHRDSLIKQDSELRARTGGLTPVSIIDKPLEERMASTVRHNRARGEHQVEAMSTLIRSMREAGWADHKIGVAMGMSADEVLRLKQVTGLAALFANEEFSKSWE